MIKSHYLSKFLFLKNAKKPNGKKTKNIGKDSQSNRFDKRLLHQDTLGNQTHNLAGQT